MELAIKYNFMKVHIFKLIISLCLILPFDSNGQGGKKYKKETEKVLTYLVSDILYNSKYYTVKKNDTIYINNRLSNKNLFKGVPLYDFYLTTSHSAESKLSDKEMKYVLYQMTKDTLETNMSFNFHDIPFKIENSTRSLNISKPIFIRNYMFCFISVGISETQHTFLFGKENKHWIFIKEIGGLSEF